MWVCWKATAADRMNCMDRSRGFNGRQFDGPSQAFSRTDFVRNCFNCGQPGHLARECQGRVFRGVELHVDYFGRDVQQRGWPYAGIRPIDLHPREAAFLWSRDNGPQGWHQQVAGDFSDSRTCGYVGRDCGNRIIPFMPNRMGDRPRDRRTGWADFDAPPNLPPHSRGSDESHRKLTSRRTNTKARASPPRRNAAAGKDLEDNDLCLRSLDHANSLTCEEIKRGFSTDVKATNPHRRKDEIFGIKPQMERDSGSEFALEHPELQVVVSACSDLGVMRASCYNEAETRNQGRGSSTHGSNAGRLSCVNTEKIDSELENGEFVSVGDDDEPVPQQSFAELTSYGNQEKHAAIKVMHCVDLESVRVKSGVDKYRDVRSFPDNPSSLRIGTTTNESEANDFLKWRSSGNARDGAELFPARKDIHQSRHEGVCQGVTQSNSSPAGNVDSIEDRNLDGEVDSCNDFGVNPSTLNEITKRRSDCSGSEVELKSSDTNLKVRCNDFGSTLTACKDRELQRLYNGDDPSESGRDLSMSFGLTGHHSSYWNNSRSSNESIEPVNYDSGGFTGLPCNANNNPFPRRSVLPELTEQQFHSEQTIENPDMREYLQAEQKLCVHMKLVPRARSQQRCTACQAEVGIALMIESERVSPNNADKVDVYEGKLTPTGDKSSLKAVKRINIKTDVLVDHYNIDARVEKLMLNFPLVQGREQDSVADALMAASQRITEEGYECGSEGLSTAPVLVSGTRDVTIRAKIPTESLAAKITVHSKTNSHEKAKVPLHASNTICWKFPTAGGDWRLTQIEKAEVVGLSGGKGVSFRKEVINMGVSLSEVGDCEVLDPRRLTHRIMVSQHRKLEVPAWACAAAFKVENSVDSQSVHYSRLTEPTAIKNWFPPHIDSPCEALSTKVIAATLKSSKHSSAEVNCQNESSATRGKELCLSTNSLRKSGHTRVSRRKYGTTNHNTANVTAQVVLAGSTFDTDLVNEASHFNPRNDLNNVGLTYSFSQPDQHSAGDPLDICSFSGKGSAVSSECSKNFVSVALRRHELQLESGEWHYVDAAGHERGPFTLSALQGFVGEGGLPAGASVLRKRDNLWVPVSHVVQYYNAHSPALISRLLPDYLERSANPVKSVASTVAFTVEDPAHPANLAPKGLSVHSVSSSIFHNEHPQFMGYTNGKLHEYVMKSFRGSFAGFFNDALDEWFNSKRSVPLLDIASLDKASEEEIDISVSLHASIVADTDCRDSMRRSFGLKRVGTKTGIDNKQDLQPLRCHQSPIGYLDVGSPFHAESSRMRKDKAGDSAPLCSETISSNVDGSLCMEHNSWSEGGHHVEDSLLYKRSLLNTSVVELDGSNSTTVSQMAVHVAVETSTGKKVRDVPSVQETSETGAVHGNHQNFGAGVSSSQVGWAWLPSRVLTKVLRLLRGDPKSLVAAMVTCQSWKDCAQDIKVSTKHIDLSCLGLSCTDAILDGLLGFGGGDLKRITLDHCLNVSPEGLERLLKFYPSICEVAICGCTRLIELVELYPQVRWVGNPFAVAHGIGTQRHGLKYNKMNFKSSGGEPEYGDDVNSGGSLDETGYRDKSIEESESPGSVRRIVNTLDPQGKDVHASQMGYSGRDFKRLKENSVNGVRNNFCVFRGKHGISKRKLNIKSAIKPQVSVRSSLKNAPVSSEKADNLSNKVSLSFKGTEKNPEKAMARALRVVMGADSEHLFYRLANEQASEGRGAPTKSGQADFCTVQKKLKLGLYGGRDGVKSFKEDLLQPLRNAFRLDHDSLTYKTAGRLFKVAHQVGQHLDNLLSKPQSRGLADGQSKAFGRCNTSTRTLLKYKDLKDLASEKQRGAKRSWDSETGARPVKRKVLSYMNSRSDGDGVSRESELQDSIDRYERELRRDPVRKSQWAKSEAESSEEEDMDEALYDEEEDTETSGSDVASKSGTADELVDDYRDASDSDDIYSGFGEGSSRDWWGARMTKAAMVPPLTRKYEMIEEYRIVDDFERVASKMQVVLPDDYEEKLWAVKKVGDRFAHLDVPELKEFKPRKRLGEDVLEQEVYGIDPYTYNLLLNTMPANTELFTENQKQLFIEERLLRALNREVSSFTGSGKAPMEYSLEKVVAHICGDACTDQPLQVFCRSLLKNMKSHSNDKYVAYRKGLGVVCNKPEGFDDGDFVVEFFGEVYPPWRWYEKQDGIRALQKKEKEPAPEFYNIVFERPKGDSWGYDVLVVDAMHKANFASRLCHSCRPNCEAKVTAVNGKYMIGVYTLRKIEFGEELTFDYCCVTESKEEHDSSVCLCGSQGCKGSYLGYTGPGAYDEVLKEYHGILDRHNLLLQACTSGAVTFREQEDLKQAGLGPCLLDGLPQWVIKYAAGIVSYLNFERQRLPDELMKAEMLKHTGIDLDRQDVEVQTEGVYNQRLQNLAITLDKVRHVLTKLYGEEVSKASPPLRMLEPHELVDYIWTGKDSVVGELLQCMAVHSPEGLADLTLQIQEHNPPPGGDTEENLRKSLLWLRDTLRKVPSTCMGRHDAAADLIHLYAYTKHFFTNYDYELVDSPPILICACDLGPKHSGAGPYMWRKCYSKNYIWGQLISWFRQTSVDPGASLVQDRRGCLMLPDISSCYARTIQHDFRCGYSNKDRKMMIMHMENCPQKKWTRKLTPELWNFKSDRGLFGSPMLDAAFAKTKINKECMQWLKTRDTVFHGPWDED